MREPTFLVLAALLEGPKHGYALLSAVNDLSDGRVNLQVGTLYGALDRLSRSGWVMESGTEIVDGRHRRYFTLTDTGARALAEETARVTARANKAAALLAQHRKGFAL